MCGEKVWGVGEKVFPEFRPKSQPLCGMGGVFVKVGTITNHPSLPCKNCAEVFGMNVAYRNR